MKSKNRLTKVIFLLTTIIISIVSLSSALSFRTEAGFGTDIDPDIFSGLGSYVRCSKSKLSMEKATVLYTWEIDKFVDYLTFLRDFGSDDFRHQTGNISFDSDKINGNWNFEISSNGTDTLITANYTFVENSENANGNFAIQLKILQPTFENLDLPLLKPTSITKEKNSESPTPPTKTKEKIKVSTSSYMFLYQSSESEEEEKETIKLLASAPNHDQNSVNTVTMTFKWTEIPIKKFLEFQNPNTELTFAFLIHGVFPKDAKILRKSSCNLDKLENKYLQNAGILRSPSKDDPYENSESSIALRNEKVFDDVKFTDYIVRIENQSIPVHGVVFYYSSPIAASLLENATTETMDTMELSDGLWSRTWNSESISSSPHLKLSSLPVIHLDNIGIGYNATVEILRYIYTQKVDNINLAKFANTIIIGAEFLQLKGLKSLCEDYLIRHITLKNVIANYVLGIDVNSNRIIRKAFAVIQANRGQIVSQAEDFRKLSLKYPNLMFELFVS